MDGDVQQSVTAVASPPHPGYMPNTSTLSDPALATDAQNMSTTSCANALLQRAKHRMVLQHFFWLFHICPPCADGTHNIGAASYAWLG